jgi:rare lipoprotein A (peptidoglycan hydrolase)
MRRVLVLLTAAVFLGVAAPGLAAPTVSQQAEEAQAKLDAMTITMATTMSAYDSAAEELAATRARIAENTKELAETDANLAVGKARLSGQVAFLYRTGGNGFIEVLVSAKSFAEFTNRMRAISIIARQDAGLIASLRANRDKAVQLQADLKAQEEQQAALLESVAKRREAADAALAEQQAYVDSLDAQVAAALEAARQPVEPHGSSGTNGSAGTASSGTSSIVELAQATVEGREGSYAVMAFEPTAYRPTGVAFAGTSSWYAGRTYKVSGQRVSGALTCAHRTLPFGTRLAVTRGDKRVIVVVNDRGPYIPGRVLDLSERAASILGFKSAGLATVQVEVVSPLQ